MLLLSILAISALALAVMAWNYVRSTFARLIIPCIRRLLGDSIADSIGMIFSWIDEPVTKTRRVARQLFATFKRQVLGMHTNFYWRDAATIEARTTSHLCKAETGEIFEQITVTTISPEDLPREIRDALVRHREAGMDLRDAVCQRMERDVLQLDIAGA